MSRGAWGAGCRQYSPTSAAGVVRAGPTPRPALQRELMAVISKYVSIRPEDIKVHLERQDNLEVLEVKIELPDALRPAR